MSTTVSEKKSKKTNKIHTLRLSGDLTVANAKSIKAEMMKALGKYQQLLLKIEEVSSLDLSVLQLIYAFQRAALSEGKSIQLDISLPEEIQSLLRKSGLAQMFNQTS